MDVNTLSPWCANACGVSLIRPRWIATSVVLGWFVFLACVGPAGATMPSAPVEVSLEFGGTVAVETDVTVTLKARPLVDTERLSLSITLPDGVDLIAGETRWEGPARSGERRALTVTIRPRVAEPRVIQGAAVLGFPDGTTLGAARSLALPLGNRSKPTLPLPPPKKTKTGESVIEYRDAP
ncbi:MAG: hypothetical protein HY207_12275 [Nitrospirae bacterium]|nr:hypothetical protein [Nitrospirota bacterium]